MSSQWVIDGLKLCARCRRRLPVSAFMAVVKLSSGLDSWCRECRRAEVRRWREANPGKVAEYNEQRRVALSRLTCVECGAEFEGRANRLLCSRRCTDARYRRLHPEEYRAKEQRKRERRRERATSDGGR